MEKKQIFYGVISIALALILFGASRYVDSVINLRDFALGLVMGGGIVAILGLMYAFGRSLRKDKEGQ